MTDPLSSETSDQYSIRPSDMSIKEKDADNYKMLIQQLPKDYINEYHRLLQFGAMFIIAFHAARRGREGKKNNYISSKVLDIQKKKNANILPKNRSFQIMLAF